MNPFKNTFIIGASQGIGKALALEYSKNGSDLFICSRNEEALKSLCDEINLNGGKCFFTRCDVTKHDDVLNAVNFAVQMLGNIDLAIINSGIGYPMWMNGFKSSEYIKILEINTIGIAHALEILVPIMKKHGYGSIAGVTSMADIRGYPGSAGYCSSKAAASILLESARVELKKENIKVITVRPGFVKTAMTAKNEFYMPMLMEPEAAARKIRKGIEKGKSVVQFPWPVIMMTNIIKYIPNWIYDWGSMLYRPAKKS